jgi:hypothetical protein
MPRLRGRAFLGSLQEHRTNLINPHPPHQVASAKVIGPAAGQVAHAGVPPFQLPLPDGAFANAKAAGEWTLTADAPT